MCILGIPEQVDVNIDAEYISAEKGRAPTLNRTEKWSEHANQKFSPLVNPREI